MGTAAPPSADIVVIRMDNLPATHQAIYDPEQRILAAALDLSDDAVQEMLARLRAPIPAVRGPVD